MRFWTAFELHRQAYLDCLKVVSGKHTLISVIWRAITFACSLYQTVIAQGLTGCRWFEKHRGASGLLEDSNELAQGACWSWLICTSSVDRMPRVSTKLSARRGRAWRSLYTPAIVTCCGSSWRSLRDWGEARHQSLIFLKAVQSLLIWRLRPLAFSRWREGSSRSLRKRLECRRNH